MADDERHMTPTHHLFFSAALAHIRQDIAAYINHMSYQRIVDIGCGTGAQLALLYGPSRDLYGLDQSLNMIEQAQKTLPETVELHHLDGRETPFSEKFFDCSILSLTLHDKHPADIELLFANTIRMTKDTGAIIIVDLGTFTIAPMSALAGKIIIPLIERRAGKRHYQNYTRWMRAGGLQSFLTRTGLRVDIISTRLFQTLLCCTINLNLAENQRKNSFELFNKTLSNTYEPP